MGKVKREMQWRLDLTSSHGKVQHCYRFYEKAGEATALIQQKPEIFDEPYQGMQSENGGVLGMLEVIASR